VGKQAADFVSAAFSGAGMTAQLVEYAIQSARQERWADALEKLEFAIKESPNDLIAWLTLAGVKGRSGDPDGEFAAIQQTLAIDPYCLPGLLLKGNWYEGHGNAVLAASTYSHALQVAPPENHWPKQVSAELKHASGFVDRHANGLLEHLTNEMAALQDDGEAADAARWREAISIRAGKSRPYVSNSNQLYIPRLPAIPFFKRSMFPFLKELEVRTDAIRDELRLALEEDSGQFEPYIGYRPGEPVNQWQKLNHSTDWKAFHLWRGGDVVEENLARCPATAKILQSIALCDLSGLCPNVFFSALAPHTHIPPHYGESNARVIAHLPLVVPDNCWFKVGFETRNWTAGETLIFDDTLEHEAMNDSDELRVVLIFDLWNPLLSDKDRKAASTLAAATRDY
jgi:aspartate beta-hydroxylase